MSECTEKQASFLRKLGGDPTGLSVAEASAEIDRRLGQKPQSTGQRRSYGGQKKVGPGPITEGQKNVLKKYGIDTTGMTKAQASARIDTIAANGWVLPTHDPEPEGIDEIPTFE